METLESLLGYLRYNLRASKRPQSFSLLWRFWRFKWSWLYFVKAERWRKKLPSSMIWLKLRCICCSSLLYQVAELRDFNTGIGGDNMAGESDSGTLFVCLGCDKSVEQLCLNEVSDTLLHCFQCDWLWPAWEETNCRHYSTLHSKFIG